MKAQLKTYFFTYGLTALLNLLIVTSGSAQTFRVVVSFPETSLDYSLSSVAVAGNTIYGATYYGGTMNDGMVFKVNTDGSGYAVLKNFTGSDGLAPIGNVVVSSNVVYGTTQGGGNGNAGVIFKVNTNGTGYTVLKYFSSAMYGDGKNSYSGLTLSGGILYGTTSQGGGGGNGTVFKINTDGTGYTVLKAFTTDGAIPKAGVVIADNVIYGTTAQGGSAGIGTVFRMNTDGGGFISLKSFTTADGQYLYSPVALLGNVLYGTALQGGASNNGTAFKVNTDGGGFTVLKNFNTSDGVGPIAGLSVVSNVLYGVTSGGGSAGNGTLFKLNPDGSDFTVLRNFITTDGISPNAGLTLSDGTLYGTTAAGGNSGGGTVFALGVGDSSGGGAHQITSHPLADGMIQLDFPGISGTNYILEQTHALNPPVMWIPVSTNTAGVDGELHFTNVVTSTNTFWRNPFLDVKKWWPARVMRPVPRIKSPLHHFNACRPKKDSTGGNRGSGVAKRHLNKFHLCFLRYLLFKKMTSVPVDIPNCSGGL